MQARTSQLAYHWPMPGGRPATKPAPKFGQRMAAFRIAKGLSQAALGEKLGMTRDRVAYYERVSSNPSFEILQKVSDFFGVTVGELLNDAAPRAVAKPGPASVLEQLAAQAASLPRSEQKAAIKMLRGLLATAS